jgi:hypothetical protein
VVTGLAGSIISAVVYARSVGLDIGTVSFHWRNGMNSVNAITHIHTSKAIIALALEAAGLQKLNESFDTGYAYAQIVPAWNSVVIGISFLAALGLALWYGPRWASTFRKDADRACATVVLSLAAGAVVKSILDGGPLAYDLVSGVLAIVLLAHRTSLSELSRHWRVPCLLLSAWIATLAILTGLGALRQLELAAARLALYASVMSVPMLLTALRSFKRLNQPQRLTWIGVPSLCMLLWTAGFMSDLRLRLLPLLRNAPPFATLYPGGGPPERRAVPAGESVASVYLSAQDNPLRARRVSIAPRSGKSTGFYADIILLAANRRALEFAPNPSVKFVRADVVNDAPSQPRQRLRSQIEMDSALGPVMFADSSGGQLADNERFVGYFLLDEYLRSSGVQEYVCIPYMQYRDQSQTNALTVAPTP